MGSRRRSISPCPPRVGWVVVVAAALAQAAAPAQDDFMIAVPARGHVFRDAARVHVNVLFALDFWHRSYARDAAELRVSLNYHQHNFSAPIDRNHVAENPALSVGLPALPDGWYLLHILLLSSSGTIIGRVQASSFTIDTDGAAAGCGGGQGSCQASSRHESGHAVNAAAAESGAFVHSVNGREDASPVATGAEGAHDHIAAGGAWEAEGTDDVIDGKVDQGGWAIGSQGSREGRPRGLLLEMFQLTLLEGTTFWLRPGSTPPAADVAAPHDLALVLSLWYCGESLRALTTSPWRVAQ